MAVQAYNPLTRQQQDEAVLRTFGQMPVDEFKGKFREAKNRLGQEADPNINPVQVATAVHDVARSFVNEYYKLTGEMPTDDQIREFTGANLDIPNVQGIITGTYAPGDMAREAGAYAKNLPRQPSAEETPQGVSDREIASIAEYINAQKEQGLQDIDTAFSRERGRAIDELGSRAGQPIARNTLNLIDQSKASSIGDLVRTLRSKGAELGYGAEQRAREFATTTGLQREGLGLQRQSLAETIKNLREDRSIGSADKLREERAAERLGKLQADMSGPGTLDYLNTAFTGLAALGGTGAVSGLASLIKKGNEPKGYVVPRANVVAR